MWKYIIDLIWEIGFLLWKSKNDCPDKWHKIWLLLKEIYYTILSKVYDNRYEFLQWTFIIFVLCWLLCCYGTVAHPMQESPSESDSGPFYTIITDTL